MAEKRANTNHTSASGNSSVQSDLANNFPTKPQFSSTTRLTSFLAPRDLTLGGNSVKFEKPKKVYTPNLNAQRKKKEEEAIVVQKNAKGPKNKHKERDRGNRHHKSNLIQSAGVFTEGFADSPKSKSRVSGYRESSDRSNPREILERPKLNAGRLVDKEEEEQKLKLLLRDDFIDDDKEFENQNCPVVLPIVSEGKLFKEEAHVKVESEDQFKVEGEENEKTAFVKNDKKKQLGNEKFRKDVKEEKKFSLNISQSLEKKTNGYFLIRLTDCLPGEPIENEEEEVRPRRNAEAKTEGDKPKTENVFDNLKDGFLGKLQILKSGSARLCLGDHNLIVDLAPQVFYREDVVVAKLDNENKTGELINLGPVHTNLICTPDWENLINFQV